MFDSDVEGLKVKAGVYSSYILIFLKDGEQSTPSPDFVAQPPCYPLIAAANANIAAWGDLLLSDWP